MKRRKELTIHSTLDELYRVEQFVEQVSDEFLLGDDYFGNIMVAVTEAVRNAIIHGNGGDPEKKVTLALGAAREGLWISVTDQGTGFDFKTQASREYLMTSGEDDKRGLLLIRSLSDEVGFQNKGRTIEMLFRINGIDESVLERRLTIMQQFMRVVQGQRSGTSGNG
jgi:serine/threonine-protein kinase RsbW